MYLDANRFVKGEVHAPTAQVKYQPTKYEVAKCIISEL